MRYSKNGVQ